MSNFAVIEDGVVVNIIVADTLSIAQEVTNSTCIEYTEKNPVRIGWIWDNKKFIAPESE
jgi:predicted type IV restriction endonuclease